MTPSAGPHPDRAFALLAFGEAIVRTVVGALLLRHLGAPAWAVLWFVLSGVRLRFFYLRSPRRAARGNVRMPRRRG